MSPIPSWSPVFADVVGYRESVEHPKGVTDQASLFTLDRTSLSLDARRVTKAKRVKGVFLPLATSVHFIVDIIERATTRRIEWRRFQASFAASQNQGESETRRSNVADRIFVIATVRRDEPTPYRWV